LTREEQNTYERLKKDVQAAATQLFLKCFPEGVPVKEEALSATSEPALGEIESDGEIRESGLEQTQQQYQVLDQEQEQQQQEVEEEESRSQMGVAIGDVMTVRRWISEVDVTYHTLIPLPHSSAPAAPPISHCRSDPTTTGVDSCSVSTSSESISPRT